MKKTKKVTQSSRLGLATALVQYAEAIDAVADALPRGAVLDIDPTDAGLNIALPAKCTKATRQRLNKVLASYGFTELDQLH